ncbi:MAG TPA: phosphoesterase, partial [Actinomycetota bacterium]
AHREPEPIGLPRNVVLAAALERRAILDGIRAGQLWIAGSPGVELSLEATAGGRSAGIGERLGAESGTPVAVRLEAAGAAGCVARLATDLGAVADAPARPDGRLALSWTTTPRASAYVRAELRRPGPAPTPAGTMVALTNPVFLGPPGPAGLGSR